MDLILIVNGEYLNMSQQFAVSQFTQNSFQLFTLNGTDTFAEQLSSSSVSYFLELTYVQNGSIAGKVVITGQASETCLQARNIYTTSSDVTFEYVPLKTQRCSTNS